MTHYVLDLVCQFCHNKYGEKMVPVGMILPDGMKAESHGTCPFCHVAPQCKRCGWPRWYCDQKGGHKEDEATEEGRIKRLSDLFHLLHRKVKAEIESATLPAQSIEAKHETTSPLPIYVESPTQAITEKGGLFSGRCPSNQKQ